MRLHLGGVGKIDSRPIPLQKGGWGWGYIGCLALALAACGLYEEEEEKEEKGIRFGVVDKNVSCDGK